jgi:hypothetical protein
MVVDYSPTRFRLFENERESAVRFVGTALQKPATEDDSTVLAEQSDFEI